MFDLAILFLLSEASPSIVPASEYIRDLLEIVFELRYVSMRRNHILGHDNVPRQFRYTVSLLVRDLATKLAQVGCKLFRRVLRWHDYREVDASSLCKVIAIAL